jgi:hypothetical protein
MLILKKLLVTTLMLWATRHALAQNAPVTAYPLARLSDAQMALMLETMAQATREHFGISVQFVAVTPMASLHTTQKADMAASLYGAHLHSPVIMRLGSNGARARATRWKKLLA